MYVCIYVCMYVMYVCMYVCMYECTVLHYHNYVHLQFYAETEEHCSHFEL